MLKEGPDLEDSFGKALVRLTTSLPGCAASLKVLLDHGVPLEVNRDEYSALFEAHGETLRVVLEWDPSLATCVAVE